MTEEFKATAQKIALDGAIEITKAYAEGSFSKGTKEIADVLEKTYRIIRKIQQEEIKVLS
jgi:hypothetical protein